MSYQDVYGDCCKLLFGTSCSRRMFKKDFCQPLEDWLFSEKTGGIKNNPDNIKLLKRIGVKELHPNLDFQQNRLMGMGARDLVIIENASGVVADIKNTQGFLERVFHSIIVKNTKNYKFLGSHSYDYDDDQDRNFHADMARKNITNPKGNYVVQMALNLANGGHYGVAIKNKNDVIVFESMSDRAYNKDFAKFAKRVFDIEPQIIEYDNYKCPQRTGGFTRDEDTDYQLQDMDAQNHFCYMWSIWFIHIMLSGKDPEEVLKTALIHNKTHPLVVIKRYIWAIINSFYPSTDSLVDVIHTAYTKGGKGITIEQSEKLAKFFLMNFRYIWSDIGTKTFQKFSIIPCKDLKKVRKFDINQCLEYSLQKSEYILDTSCDI